MAAATLAGKSPWRWFHPRRDGGDGRPPKPELTGGLQPEVPTIESSPAEPESEPLAEPAENEADKLD